jgi:hypothetical protein
MKRALGILMLVAACGGGGGHDTDGGGEPDANAIPDGAPADAGPATLTVHPGTSSGGSGAVVSDPSGIDCGTTCSAVYDAGTVVTLTATPDPGSMFVGWGGVCTGTDTCTVTMNGDRDVYAVFGQPRLSVELGGDGNGTVTSSVAGIDCGSDCEEVYPADTVVTLTATPDSDSYFLGWSGACTGTDPCTLTLTAAQTAHADFSYENGTTTFTATKQGDPKWEIVGWQIFYGSTLLTFVENVWNLHEFNNGAFQPDTVHAPPYDTELADRLAVLGLDPGSTFPMEDWTAPKNLYFAAVIVPSADAPVGSTTDYASGPYISKVLQLYSDADLYKDATVVDPDFDSTYPTLTQLMPGTPVDGWSHMTLTYGEGTQYIAGTPGNYRLHVHIYETLTPGNGWTVDLPLTIVAN